MAHLLAARVGESSTTTGTGSFTLSGAITGHRTFASALATNDTTEYAIIADDGSWEVGVGTLSASTTLARTTIAASSNAGSAVNFAAGNKTVVVTPLSASLQGRFEGTARRITGDMSNATVSNRLAFQSSTTNGNTAVSAIPNGTGTQAQFVAYAAADPTNSAFGALTATTTALQLISNKTGTASSQPLQVVIDGTTRATFAAGGDITLSGDAIFSNAIKEKVTAITDGPSVDINPSAGTIQTWTLGANRTPTAGSFLEGESVTLMVLDGSGFAITWSSISPVWVGGAQPTLDTTKYTVIQLWKVGTTVYGAAVGYA